MNLNELINWLLKGDISIRYQTYRDLLNSDKPKLRSLIAKEGWGFQLLANRNNNGHWGKAFYQPKWTSTHYTLLDLRNLNISPTNQKIIETIQMILKEEKAGDGGIKPIGSNKKSDLCINGMFLNYASYFHANESELKSVIDCILEAQLLDGGFNCRSNRVGEVHHSSLHTTLSILEGIQSYHENGYRYRIKELKKVQKESHEFILKHHLYQSDHTGEVIHPGFIKFYYPCRWYYDVMKAIDYFRLAGVQYDDRMEDALQLILSKRQIEGTWKIPAAHPGKVFFKMEQAGKPSRWNTLRALRVLKFYQKLSDPFDFKTNIG